MDKEKMNQIINEAYKNYCLKSKDVDLPENLYNKLIDDLNKDAMFPIDNPNRMIPKEGFINKIKTNPEFSEKWGLKIEERELDMMERWELADLTPNMTEFDYCNKLCDEHNVPTKLITITYNNETIEIYE